MSVIKGFRNLKHKAEQLFVSLDKVTGGRAATLSTIKLPLDLALANLAIASIDLQTKNIEITGHTLRDTDDVIKVKTGTAVDIEIFIESIVDANNIIAVEIPSGLLAGDEVMPMRYSSLKMSGDGDLIVSQGPIQFTLDGAPQEVTEDTGNSANNRPLPVKLTGVTGDINITANDLNVQLSHNAANPDSVQVGNGVNIMQVNASGEATVRDADAITQLTTISGKLPSTIGRKADTDSLSVALSTEDKTVLDSIDGKDFATQTTLAALEGKDFATQTTLAALEGKDFATQTTLASVLADTTSIDGKLPDSVGAKLSAASLSVVLASDHADIGVTVSSSALPTGAATEATLAALAAEDFATQTTLAALEGKDFATQTTLALIENKDFATENTLAGILVDTTSISGKLPATLGRKAEGSSLAVVLSTEDKTALDAINTNLNGVIGAITNKEVHESTFLANPSLNTGTYLAVGAAIPFGVTIREIEVKYEDGVPIELFDASAGTSLGIIAQGEGKIPVAIVGDNAKQIHVRALGTNFAPTNFILNAIKGN
jgi:hypothetical protein